jgi:hypothetical protein
MTRRTRWSGALITAALAAGLVAEPAGAKVTFSGIGDVKLGMSEADVREELGRPSSTGRWTDGRSTLLKFRRRKIEVVVDRDSGQVMGIKTTSRGQRTSSGLGVGSSERTVRARLRGERCSTALDKRVCSLERGGRVMDFVLRRAKVVHVAVTRTG